MKTYLAGYGSLAFLVAVLSISAAGAWNAHSERALQRPKTVAELVGRLNERNAGLHVIASGVNSDDLERGVYVADHPITESVRILTLSHPEDWTGVVLIRRGNGSNYCFPAGVAKERTLATDDFFLTGDPALLAKMSEDLN